MPKFKHLVLIDDDPQSCFLIKHYLERSKIAAKYTEFNSSSEALDFLQKNVSDPPEIILLDILMPVIDGFECLEKIHLIFLNAKRKPDIFMLTSSNNPKDVSKAGKYKVAGYLLKPLTEQKLEHLKSYHPISDRIKF